MTTRSRLASGALAATLLVCACALLRATPSIERQQSEHLSRSVQVELEYLLYLPPGYDPHGEKRWPLVMFLHGAGERGNDLRMVARHGPPRLVEEGRDFPFVLASPQCPEDDFWSNEKLGALLDALLAGHAIDPSRVYLTGLSMGGFGTWSFGASRSETFAAIAPICGGGSWIDAWRLAKMPVWAFHGEKDEIVPPAESKRMIETLRAQGNENAKLTLYPDAGHDSWTQTYAGPAFFEWLLAQRREGH
jgi:predicted peptidase